MYLTQVTEQSKVFPVEEQRPTDIFKETYSLFQKYFSKNERGKYQDFVAPDSSLLVNNHSWGLIGGNKSALFISELIVNFFINIWIDFDSFSSMSKKNDKENFCNSFESFKYNPTIEAISPLFAYFRLAVKEDLLTLYKENESLKRESLSLFLDVEKCFLMDTLIKSLKEKNKKFGVTSNWDELKSLTESSDMEARSEKFWNEFSITPPDPIAYLTFKKLSHEFESLDVIHTITTLFKENLIN